MSRVRVHQLSVSLDGYLAGRDQSEQAPLGRRGELLHEWIFATASARVQHGLTGGASGVDDDWVARGQQGIGATIIGRNMFGPVRGPWPDETWRGWWGEEPPYHHPVFVLTRHPRRPLAMAGGTTFHFVTDGIRAALDQARAAADGADVVIGGGAATLRQYLCAGLVDEAHLAIVPVLLGDGERLFEGLHDLPDRYEVAEHAASDAVLHVRLVRRTP